MADKKYKTRDILLVSSYLTELEGYHSVSEGDKSTKALVISYLETHPSLPDLSSYQTRAEKAIQWIKEEPSSDWIDSIRNTLKKVEIEDKYVGIVASLFKGYDTFLIRNKEKEQLLKSEYQGSKGETITFTIKSCRFVTKGVSSFNNKPFYLYQFIDTKDNVYNWFSESEHKDEFDSGMDVGAKVLSHKERDRVKITNIKILEVL